MKSGTIKRNHSISAQPTTDNRSKANMHTIDTEAPRHASAMKSKYSQLDPYNDEGVYRSPNNVTLPPDLMNRQNRLLDNGNGGYAASKRHYYDSPLATDNMAYRVMSNEKDN